MLVFAWLYHVWATMTHESQQTRSAPMAEIAGYKHVGAQESRDMRILANRRGKREQGSGWWTDSCTGDGSTLQLWMWR
jgi:hypothetical protein